MRELCIWNKENVLKLFEKLQKYYSNSIKAEDFIALKLLMENANPFEILIGILLSQNTSDRNAYKALMKLREKLGGGITPERILMTPTSEIVEAIKVAGLVNRRLRSIIEISKYVYSNKEFFTRLKGLETEDARRELLSLHGIGYKTADVFLLMVYKRPTFPIDTHVSRVLKRLGIVHIKMNYEDIRKSIQNIMNNDSETLFKFHLLLITHGRSICRARNPRCDICPIKENCCRIGL